MREHREDWTPPDVIYLQPCEAPDVTWCEDDQGACIDCGRENVRYRREGAVPEGEREHLESRVHALEHLVGQYRRGEVVPEGAVSPGLLAEMLIPILQSLSAMAVTAHFGEAVREEVGRAWEKLETLRPTDQQEADSNG